jgi:hypothetical protein
MILKTTILTMEDNRLHNMVDLRVLVEFNSLTTSAYKSIKRKVAKNLWMLLLHLSNLLKLRKSLKTHNLEVGLERDRPHRTHVVARNQRRKA